MRFGNFFLKCLGLLLLCTVLGAVYVYLTGRWEAAGALAVGIGIAFLNALLGFAILGWGFRRSHKDFMLSVFGGMIFRFLLIFAFLFVLIGATQIDRVALVASLVAAYFLFLGLEILQIHRYSDVERA